MGKIIGLTFPDQQPKKPKEKSPKIEQPEEEPPEGD